MKRHQATYSLFGRVRKAAETAPEKSRTHADYGDRVRLQHRRIAGRRHGVWTLTRTGAAALRRWEKPSVFEGNELDEIQEGKASRQSSINDEFDRRRNQETSCATCRDVQERLGKEQGVSPKVT